MIFGALRGGPRFVGVGQLDILFGGYDLYETRAIPVGARKQEVHYYGVLNAGYTSVRLCYR